MAFLHVYTAICIMFSFLVTAAPFDTSMPLATRQTTDKLVFCHFMVGDLGEHNLLEVLNSNDLP